ncbi:Stress responsive A/B Barrel Domain protein [uncultured archaeon]|nr:Stress responsive A/B Barrel Domain protein [uncultured archaeon]
MVAIEHRVYYRLKPGTSADQFMAFYENIIGLKGKIEGIGDIYFKRNISKEGKDHGCGGFFAVLFKDISSLNTYVGHPEHERVASEYFRPIRSYAFVADNEI